MQRLSPVGSGGVVGGTRGPAGGGRDVWPITAVAADRPGAGAVLIEWRRRRVPPASDAPGASRKGVLRDGWRGEVPFPLFGPGRTAAAPDDGRRRAAAGRPRAGHDGMVGTARE